MYYLKSSLLNIRVCSSILKVEIKNISFDPKLFAHFKIDFFQFYFKYELLWDLNKLLVFNCLESGCFGGIYRVIIGIMDLMVNTHSPTFCSVERDWGIILVFHSSNLNAIKFQTKVKILNLPGSNNLIHVKYILFLWHSKKLKIHKFILNFIEY